MKIIGSAAYFTLCGACGLHGRIICADGTRSFEVATKAGAEREVAKLLKANKIEPDEVPELKRQVGMAFGAIGGEDEELEKWLLVLQETKKAVAIFENELRKFHEEELGITGPNKEHGSNIPDKRTLH